MEVESESESLDSSTDSDPDHPPSQIQDKTTKKLKKIEAVKLASIYDSMKQLGYTPKKFIKAFLENTDKKYTGHRPYWGSERGWESTLAVLDAIKKVATKIVISQKPPSGAYPRGAYHSSTTITEELFTQECKDERDTDLVEDHMPFLFRLVCNKLNARPVKKVPSADPSQDDVLPAEEDPNSDTKEVPEDLFDEADPRFCAECQSTCDHGRRVRMAEQWTPACQRTHIPRLWSFGSSKPIFQLHRDFFLSQNSSSSVKTSRPSIKRKGCDKDFSINLGDTGPLPVHDNLDFEQKVHDKSLGKENQMFHGTWGYVHHPNSEMLASIPATNLTMESYRKQWPLSHLSKFFEFLPSRDEEDSWELVLKAQIADVLLDMLPLLPTQKFQSPPVHLPWTNSQPTYLTLPC
ncbi:hypothetical protein PSTT_09092 [Puccinia striiformis]|uniref:Uncharacterized protein n=1 Tax=Puccinia striiformis TaxID=27350 RepID=A0A2S4V9N7_9BASI|nr:hypothetical protein PSTT_09092 [Puccinia striiformis]